MITLDQIKQLDIKVRKAVDKINTLKSENSLLQEKLDNYQLRIEELEILIDTFKEDQGEIEHGIIDALNQLDIIEDNTLVNEEILQKESTSTDPEQQSEESNLSEAETVTEVEVDVETEQESPITEEKEDKIAESTDDSADSEIELDIF